MLAQRNAAGGLASAGGRPTEANSTAGAIRALRAMGRTPRPTPARPCAACSSPTGAFRFTRAVAGSRLLATDDAVVAVAGAWLPPG